MCDTNRNVYAWGFFFFPVMQAKTNVHSQLVKLSQVKTARYGHGKKYGVRRCVKQLTAKQSTQKPPEVTGVENGKIRSVVKRDKEKILRVFRERMWHLNKIEEKVCTPSTMLTAEPHQDEGLTSRFRLWKNLCALTGVVDWELRIVHLFFPPFFS